MTDKKQISMWLVDAPTGAGKTTAIIQEVNKNAIFNSDFSKTRYIVVTPYLDEIERIKASTSLKSPEVVRNVSRSKRESFLKLVEDKENIVCSHALFRLLGMEVFDTIKDSNINWRLIIDEEFSCVDDIQSGKTQLDKDNHIIKYSRQDIRALEKLGIIGIDDKKQMVWNNVPFDDDLGFYDEGVFMALHDLLEVADVYQQGSGLISVVKRSVWESFSEVTICGYRLKGSKFEMYCKLIDVDIKYMHINSKGEFEDGYKDLKPCGVKCVHAYTSDFPPKWSFSKTFYDNHFNKTKTNSVKQVNDNKSTIKYKINWFKDCIRKILPKKDRTKYYWTVYTSYKEVFKIGSLLKQNDKAFVPCNIKATNEFKSYRVAYYLVDLYLPPNISNFFKAHGIELDQRRLALSNFIQFVWRGTVRDITPATYEERQNTHSMYVFVASRSLYDDFKEWQQD